jgi:hypothetical protein
MDQRLGSSSEDVLATPIQGGYSLTTQERRDVDLASTIPGWGSDLDRKLRPGVPRDKAPEIGAEHLFPAIEAQMPEFKIHKSTEHARLTPVFGTSCPPGGLSGKIRDMAYTMSEGRIPRWLALVAADRVDMVEGVLTDLAHLQLPNVARETGLATELRYNRPAFVRKVAIGAALMLGMVVILRSRHRGQ